MRPLYQPRAAWLAACGWVLCLGCVGCGRGEPDAPPPPPGRSWPLAVFLDSRGYELVGVEADGAAVALESGADSPRAVRVRSGGGVEALAPTLAAAATASRPLAVVPGRDAGVVIEIAIAGAPPQLALVARGAVRRFGGDDERFLGVSADGRSLWSARPSASGDELVETALPQLGRRAVAVAPPGFRLAAVAGDGSRAAAVRALHDEADEVVLLDRRTGERRLLLPTGDDGRFRPIELPADGRRLLLIADDRTDLPRLEWLEFATSERAVALETPCAVVAVQGRERARIADLGCLGVREAVPLAPGDQAPGPGWPSRLPPGSRAVAIRPAPFFPPTTADWWLGLAGPRAARDLVRLPAGGALEAATWGLAPRLAPEALPVPIATTVSSGGFELPAELWPPSTGASGGPAAGVVWLESDARAPSWGEFEPFLAHLAARGVAVLRLRSRGADGFGRAQRRAGDGDPAGAALSDLRAAAAQLAREPGLADRPLAAIGVGPLAGAAATTAAALDPPRFAAAVAIDPAADPLAALDEIATAAEPRRSRLIARWGDPADARTIERRGAFAAAATRARRPLLVVLDRADAATAARLEALDATAVAGAPVRAVDRVRPPLADGVGRRALEECWSFLSRALELDLAD